MKARTLVICALVLFGAGLRAQTPPVGAPSAEQLAEITARGRALAEYDAAAWHATDAVEPLKPAKGTFERYVARKMGDGWVVMFGKYNGEKTKFLIAYEARQAADPTEYKVTLHEPPIEDSDYFLHAAKAHEIATAEFMRVVKAQRPYNISILPAASGGWYVYAIPAQTTDDVLPYGGDLRYTVSADGSKILETRQMHKTVLEERILKTTEYGFHTHILSDIPEDSDVFYSMTRKAVHGEIIATKRFFYAISPDNILSCLGATEDIVKLLEAGRFEAIPAQYQASILTSARRLLGMPPPPAPVEAVVEYFGARCADHTIWLKFSERTRNISDTKVVLYKNPLQNSQARFGATSQDILAGKYEKLLFVSVEKLDTSDASAFMILDPGTVHKVEREYPILGMDLRGKGYIQFMFFTWPLGEEKEIETVRVKLAGQGSLFADTVTTAPLAINVDPSLLKSCGAK